MIRGGDWEPAFFRASALFAPIAPAASRLASFDTWPEPGDLARLFSADAGVAFEAPPPKPRRSRSNDAIGYDARIAIEGVVPTRPRSWHDLINALVWATFPRAKRALHARQHRMIAARAGESAATRGARTKEQDAVAMLDEGGVAIVCTRGSREAIAGIVAAPLGDISAWVARGEARVVIFGHAIYEGLACGGPSPVHGAARIVEVEDVAIDPRGIVDASLADFLGHDAPIGRADFGSVRVDDALAAACA